jgi:hypothetical protein
MDRWTSTPRRLLPALALAVALVAAFALLEYRASPGDYPIDAGPALDALAAGRLHQFFVDQPLMGLLSVLLRLPFVVGAKLAGGGELWRYRLGVLPCLLVAGVFGFWLARLKGLRPDRALLVPLLALLTPASVTAVNWGHPEELVGGVLCVAALLVAPRRPLLAGVVLGLAVATKQWALLAVAPVILAAPAGRRWRLLAIAVVVAEALTLPLFVGNTAAFTHIGNEAAAAAPSTRVASLWFLVAKPHEVWAHGALSTTFYDIPAVVSRGSHPLIVLLSPLLTLVAWRRRGDALALLALVLLARCVLDPVDNEYYHAPFVLALLAWEVMRGRTVPRLTLFACVGLWLTFHCHLAAPVANGVYLAWTLAIGSVLFAATASASVAARLLARPQPA